MNNEWIWTDELIKEYGRYCVLNNTWLQWEDFKESKQPKLDYEILMCKGADMPAHDYQPSVCLGRNKQALPCTIYSVKRLSDNEVFTIGDIVGCILKDTIFDIEEIEISGEPYLINKKLNHYMPLRNAYKTKYPIDLNPKLIEVKLTKFELYKLMKLING